MEAILAARYTFFVFSNVPGFPNPVPGKEEWECCLPRFRGNNWDIPTEYLLQFHELMHQLNIAHEDVLIKMFKYSLEGSAQEWCRYLSPSNISSLKDFHAAFHYRFKRYFTDEFLFENCCEELKSSLYHQEDCVCNSEQEMEIDGQYASSDQIQEDTVFFSLHVVENENLIEHIVYPLQIHEIISTRPYFHTNFATMNSAKEFFVQ
jgi:hypothetical protein